MCDTPYGKKNFEQIFELFLFFLIKKIHENFSKFFKNFEDFHQFICFSWKLIRFDQNPNGKNDEKDKFRKENH